MSPRKFFDLLVSFGGRVFAQIACFCITWIVIGAIFRFFVWIDGSVSGGIEPVHFAMVSMISFGMLVAWRMFANADLDG